MSWLALLAILPLGALVTVAYDHLSGNREERRKFQREGSAVVIPAKEVVNSVGPEALIWGTDEELDAYLRERHQKWWNELRAPLMVYLGQHPSSRVRELGEEFATSVAVAISSTRYLLATRNTSTTMAEHDDADGKKKQSMALADDLLAEIRRRWRWLRWPR